MELNGRTMPKQRKVYILQTYLSGWHNHSYYGSLKKARLALDKMKTAYKGDSQIVKAELR